ncbi:MAG: ribonucleoside-diphosphate reductase subunit alpha [Actinobacteria bacterium]|nr:ribonucleoside-diphosphate reductase subunit alpha [Actinomycetota bacterium]
MNSVEQNMNVVKRDGRREEVAFEKVQERISKSSVGLVVNATKVAQGVLTRIVDGITTTELDNITANLAYSWSTIHPDYATLASRIAISNHQKNTPKTMLEVVNILCAVKDKTGHSASLLAADFIDTVRTNADVIEAHINYDRDFEIDFFGFKTLEKAYLLRDTERRVVERPQHLWMRVALGLWLHDLPKAFEAYDLMSLKYYTHATPTLFNSGTKRPQLSSCFLLAMKDDSIRGIYDTLQDCALISQYGGGIGLHISNIRAQGALIRGTGGVSNGIVPMLRVFNNTARYVDQCFTADTKIHTKRGDIPICEIVAGDEVLTSGTNESVDEFGKHYQYSNKNRFCTVARLVKHIYTGRLVNVCVNGITVRVTPQHPLLALRKNGDTFPDYFPVSELRIGDHIASVNTEKGMLFHTIQSITDADEFSGELYDLEVNDVHDYYVSEFGFAHNGGGKRNGSFAMYLEPWHADVEHFLEMKKNTGSEEERARDLFYAMWVPDLFMERVDANGDWTLFCPSEAPGLADVVGDEFKTLYERYEAEGRGRKSIKAQKLWFQILDSQIETGTPYLLYKDAANLKSNQQNLGVIKSSNLCCEVIEFSSPAETAVCNLASLSLPAFVKNGVFDFKQLRKVTNTVIKNLNRVIDINYYPIPEAERSNMRHRPIGLGVQGLADVFAMMGLPWESEEAVVLNKRIFAHMYYAALSASCDLAASEGRYETYVGSPAFHGKLQFDLWNVKPLPDEDLDWDSLLNDISRIGLRNSLLIAPMPTASTSQILGNCECIEPYATHIFTRRTLAGEFIVLNKHLVKALLDRGLWTPEIKDAIIGNNGSVTGLPMIPEDIQRIFKTVWEIKQKTLIDMAADRGPYICQSQSLNLFLGDPDYRKLTSMHFYAWRKGLKTGIYYLRTRAVASAQKFTVEPTAKIAVKDTEECVMCSS